MDTIEKFETTAGTVWSKVEMSDGSIKHRKNGQFAKQQSYAAGATYRTETYVKDGESTPTRPTEIPVPGDGPADIEYKQVEQRDASAVGSMVSDPDPLVTEYEIDGETYTADQLKGAYRRSRHRRRETVRYSI